MGLSTGLLETGTTLPYLGPIGLMGTAGLITHSWVPTLAARNLTMVPPPVLLYTGHRLLGERLRPRLDRWREKVDSGSREAPARIIGIVGFLLLLNGLAQVGFVELIDDLPRSQLPRGDLTRHGGGGSTTADAHVHVHDGGRARA